MGRQAELLGQAGRSSKCRYAIPEVLLTGSEFQEPDLLGGNWISGYKKIEQLLTVKVHVQ